MRFLRNVIFLISQAVGGRCHWPSSIQFGHHGLLPAEWPFLIYTRVICLALIPGQDPLRHPTKNTEPVRGGGKLKGDGVGRT
jgi:hypothetical protein